MFLGKKLEELISFLQHLSQDHFLEVKVSNSQ